MEYFTKNAAARKRTNPPIQANKFTPMNRSQLIEEVGGTDRGGFGGTFVVNCGFGGEDGEGFGVSVGTGGNGEGGDVGISCAAA
jgi:hypothetical protein